MGCAASNEEEEINRVGVIEVCRVKLSFKYSNPWYEITDVECSLGYRIWLMRSFLCSSWFCIFCIVSFLSRIVRLLQEQKITFSFWKPQQWILGTPKIEDRWWISINHIPGGCDTAPNNTPSVEALSLNRRMTDPIVMLWPVKENVTCGRNINIAGAIQQFTQWGVWRRQCLAVFHLSPG